MHIAFVSQFDARDVRAWSGIPLRIAEELARHVEKVSLVTPLSAPRQIGSTIHAIRARMRGQTYLRQHTEAVARVYAEQANRHLRRLRPDVVLAPSSLPLAYLDTDAPAAFWSDATFESNLFRYGLYANMTEEHIKEGHRVEAAAFSRVARAFYAGEHAVRSAVDYYGVKADKVVAVPFGANLPEVPPRDHVLAQAAARPTDRCELLFIGQEWSRKGGDVAVRVAGLLNERGLPTTLRVIGTAPPLMETPNVEMLGFVSKRTEAERARFAGLVSRSHFLLQPARVENFGCVYCEASAFAVPSIAAAVDGVPLAVRDGVNGLLFPPRPAPGDIADAIFDLMRSPEEYMDLSRRSRAEFDERLNWTSATEIVVQHLRDIL